MSEYLVNEINIDNETGRLTDEIESIIESGGTARIKVTNSKKRSLALNAFQHVIYKKISDYLISKGRDDWSPGFTKKNLKNKFLGWEETKYIDIATGEEIIKSELKKTSELNPGDSYQYTTMILAWADSIGCFIEIPVSCEYRELMERQVR